MVIQGGFPPSPCAYAPLYARQAITLGGNQTISHAVGREPMHTVTHTA